MNRYDILLKKPVPESLEHAKVLEKDPQNRANGSLNIFGSLDYVGRIYGVKRYPVLNSVNYRLQELEVESQVSDEELYNTIDVLAEARERSRRLLYECLDNHIRYERREDISRNLSVIRASIEIAVRREPLREP